MKLKRGGGYVEVCGVKLGGEFGQLPTVLIGSIFYDRESIVEDPLKGVFDKEKAEKYIKQQEEYSELTGNPCMIDVMASSCKAIEKYLEFTLSVTDSPILIDSTSLEVKLHGLRFLKEVGALSKAIYNSLNYHYSEEEVRSLREIGVESAIVLAMNPRNPLPNGKLDVLIGENGLLSIARKAGIKNVLVDVAVLDVPSIALAGESIQLIKGEVGLPCGGAPLNALLEWKSISKLGASAKEVCSASTLTYLRCLGADFIIYGPIEKAPIVFPAVAVTDAIIAYGARWRGLREIIKTHPLYKIFK